VKEKTKERLNTISGVLYFIAFVPYIIAILSRETIPSPVSWAIWASVDTLALFAMKKEDATRGQLTGAVCGAWFVTVLAIIFGKPTMGSIEWVSIVGALLGIILWKKTRNAVAAIICSQIAVFVGAIPTFIHAYQNPAQENALAWIIWTISCFCALFAIKKWNIANALQPITFTVIEVIMVILVVLFPYIF